MNFGCLAIAASSFVAYLVCISSLVLPTVQKPDYCGCPNPGLSYYNVDSYNKRTTCETTCTFSCPPYYYEKFQTVSNGVKQLIDCSQCQCSSSLIYVATTLQSNYAVGYYNCTTGCLANKCYWAKTATIINSQYIFVCQLCPNDCETCVNGTYCLTCTAWAIFNASNNQCIPCSRLFGNGCYSCTLTNCLTCRSDAAKNTKMRDYCLLCSTNSGCSTCKDGVNGPVCTKCSSDAAFNLSSSIPQGQCIYCSRFIANCKTCTDGPTACLSCWQGSFFNLSLLDPSQQCVSCYSIPNCANCIVGPVCIACITGAYFNTSTTLTEQQCIRCTVFVPNCDTCTDGPVCTACRTGYFFNLSSTATQKPCVACSSIKNCAACTAGPICSQCRTNTFMNLTSPLKQCQYCSIFPNCATCLDGPRCTACLPLHYFNTSSTENSKPCLPCSMFANCSTCVDGPVCTACIALHYFDLSAAQYTCVPCSFSNCATCVNGPLCTDCQSGYFLDSSISPKPLCFSCSSISNCAQCMTTQPICTACVTGAYHDFSTGIYSANPATNSCVLCQSINNCLSCADGYVCLSCERNFIIDVQNSNKSCLACANDEYSFNNVCLKCQLDVQKCISCYHTGSMVNCTACSYPFRVNVSGKCDACEVDFQLLDGQCIKPIGCQIATNNYEKCIACFSVYNFIFEPTKKACVCKQGYQLVKRNGFSQCDSVCGDGITSFPDEKCDDGNLRDGDGCDSICKVENDFWCSVDSPSKCTLFLNVTELKYNYAYRIEGKNRCKFSFSVLPFHSAFKCVAWSNYLNINISEDFMIANSLSYDYIPSTNEITLEFDYKQTIEELSTKVTLSFGKKSARLLQVQNRDLVEIVKEELVQVASQSAIQIVGLEVFSIPESLSVDITIYGKNIKLTFDDQALLMAYKTLSVGYLTITIIITSLFLVGSYFHKMIGLQTVQILQFVYVINMLVDQEPALKPLNVLKYSALGGYSNYELIYGGIAQEAQLLTFATVYKKFVAVGLMRFFLMNANFPLVLPIIALVGYGIYMVKKYRQRAKYLRLLEVHEKDLYTTRRRKAQWVYDHLVFPLVNLFSFIAFFCTILYLAPNQKSSKLHLQNESQFDLIQKTSFIPNLFFVFLTFFVISYEIFLSYEQFVHSRLTEQQKLKIPISMMEKLQHDQNNPDRENYKPGYVLVYMVYYFLVEFVLLTTVLNQQMSIYGLEVMLGLSGLYWAIVCCWEPYYKAVQFHNKALKFNHFASVLFTGSCLLMKCVGLSKMSKIVIVFVNLFVLTVMCLFELVRFRVEYKFRKDLTGKPDLLVEGKKNKSQTKKESEQLSKRQQHLKNNKYSFTAQISEYIQRNKIPVSKFDENDEDTIETVKKMIQDEIYSKQKQELKIETTFLTPAMFQSEQPQKKTELQQTNRRKKRVTANNKS